MQPKRFPIGFWAYGDNYLPEMEAMVAEWADLGFSLGMTPPFGESQVGQVRQLLNLAHAQDIQMIVCDNRAHGPASCWSDPKKLIPLPADYAGKAAAKDFEDHPGAWALHVVDEPLQGNLPGVAEACRIVRGATPRLHPFVNLLPDHIIWGGVTEPVGFKNFGEYLDHYLKVTGDDMLCFDCYCQNCDLWGGRDRYFLNLEEYQAAAIRNNVPFWIITLAIGHWLYRVPTVSEMLWQFNTALAYGAQGILYFLYRAGGEYGYGAPVDELGQRGPLYHQLKRQHTYFRRYWEERFRKLRPTRTTHYPKAPPGCRQFDGTGLVSEVSFNAGESEVLIGEFVDDRGRPHVMIVNNDTERHVWFTMKCAGRNVHQIGERGEAAGGGSTTGEIAFGGPLLPSAALLYRLEP